MNQNLSQNKRLSQQIASSTTQKSEKLKPQQIGTTIDVTNYNSTQKSSVNAKYQSSLQTPVRKAKDNFMFKSQVHGSGGSGSNNNNGGENGGRIQNKAMEGTQNFSQKAQQNSQQSYLTPGQRKQNQFQSPNLSNQSKTIANSQKGNNTANKASKIRIDQQVISQSQQKSKLQHISNSHQLKKRNLTNKNATNIQDSQGKVEIGEEDGLSLDNQNYYSNSNNNRYQSNHTDANLRELNATPDSTLLKSQQRRTRKERAQEISRRSSMGSHIEIHANQNELFKQDQTDRQSNDDIQISDDNNNQGIMRSSSMVSPSHIYRNECNLDQNELNKLQSNIIPANNYESPYAQNRIQRDAATTNNVNSAYRSLVGQKSNPRIKSSYINLDQNSGDKSQSRPGRQAKKDKMNSSRSSRSNSSQKLYKPASSLLIHTANKKKQENQQRQLSISSTRSTDQPVLHNFQPNQNLISNKLIHKKLEDDHSKRLNELNKKIKEESPHKRDKSKDFNALSTYMFIDQDLNNQQIIMNNNDEITKSNVPVIDNNFANQIQLDDLQEQQQHQMSQQRQKKQRRERKSRLSSHQKVNSNGQDENGIQVSPSKIDMQNTQLLNSLRKLQEQQDINDSGNDAIIDIHNDNFADLSSKLYNKTQDNRVSTNNGNDDDQELDQHNNISDIRSQGQQSPIKQEHFDHQQQFLTDLRIDESHPPPLSQSTINNCEQEIDQVDDYVSTGNDEMPPQPRQLRPLSIFEQPPQLQGIKNSDLGLVSTQPKVYEYDQKNEQNSSQKDKSASISPLKKYQNRSPQLQTQTINNCSAAKPQKEVETIQQQNDNLYEKSSIFDKSNYMLDNNDHSNNQQDQTLNFDSLSIHKLSNNQNNNKTGTEAISQIQKLTVKDQQLIQQITRFIQQEDTKSQFMRDLQYFIRNYDGVKLSKQREKNFIVDDKGRLKSQDAKQQQFQKQPQNPLTHDFKNRDNYQQSSRNHDNNYSQNKRQHPQTITHKDYMNQINQRREKIRQEVQEKYAVTTTSTQNLYNDRNAGGKRSKTQNPADKVIAEEDQFKPRFIFKKSNGPQINDRMKDNFNEKSQNRSAKKSQTRYSLREKSTTSRGETLYERNKNEQIMNQVIDQEQIDTIKRTTKQDLKELIRDNRHDLGIASNHSQSIMSNSEFEFASQSQQQQTDQNSSQQNIFNDQLTKKIKNARAEFDEELLKMKVKIIEKFTCISNPLGDDFSVGAAMILLISISNENMQLSSDKATKINKDWDLIKKYLGSSMISFHLEQLRDKIYNINFKKCKPN
eukprot:403357442